LTRDKLASFNKENTVKFLVAEYLPFNVMCTISAFNVKANGINTENWIITLSDGAAVILIFLMPASIIFKTVRIYWGDKPTNLQPEGAEEAEAEPKAIEVSSQPEEVANLEGGDKEESKDEVTVKVIFEGETKPIEPRFSEDYEELVKAVREVFGARLPEVFTFKQND